MTNKPISLAPVPTNPEVRAEIIVLWEQGFDTKDIASRVGRPESWVYNTLWKWRLLAKSEAST